MEIINNRYRIIKKLNQNRILSSFIVSDIINDYKIMRINILNSEYIPDNLINFYTTEFVNLSNINCTNISKVYNYGLVNLIDNKKTKEEQYYFTNEYFENQKRLKDVLLHKNKEEILNLFVEICNAVNYLHLKGFSYNDTIIDNIMVVEFNGTERAVLKDIATIELEKYFYWENMEDKKFVRPPEILEGKGYNKASNIYCLGIVLMSLYFNNYDELKNIESDITWNQYLDNLKSKYNDKFFIKIINVISKMINENPQKRYISIIEIVKDINKLFNKNYRSQNIQELEKLNFNIDLVGRNQEVKEINNTYNSIKNEKIDSNIILVHGETGIGKTKLLSYIEFKLKLSRANVYSSYVLNNYNKFSNKAFIEILRQLVIESNGDILKKYESELVKFMPELREKRDIIPSEPLNGDKENFRLINRTAGFISELIDGETSVFIIDNFHLSDEFTIDFFEYLLMNNSKNVLFILSYCDGECVLNKKFTNFISKISKNITSKKILLKGLDVIETAQICKNILSMPYGPMNIAAKIHERTNGNPLFIEEVIKNLVNRSSIYIDKDNGMWSTDYGYEELPIPVNMEQAVLNQIKGFNEFVYSILSIMSLFKKPISINIISLFLNCDEKKIEVSINELMAKGILCKKIGDTGFVYDFYNKFLKNIIYEKISYEDKITNHKIAADILESQYKHGGEEYLQELIDHLEMSNQKKKIIDYCLQNSIKMIKLKNRNDAIRNLEKALSMYSVDFVDNNKVKIISLLANIYYEDENYTLAKYYFEMLKTTAESVNNVIYQIDALNKIAQILLKENKFDESKMIIDEVNNLFCKVKYEEGYFENSYLKSIIYLVNQEYEKSMEICKEGIELCGNSFYKYKGEFYNVIGNVYLDTSKAKEAIENFQYSISFFKKAKCDKGLIKALNNIGVIYADFYQNFERALDYYNKVDEICNNNNFISDEIKAKSNIASICFLQRNYNISIQYLQSVIDKCNKNNFSNDLLYAYIIMANSYIKLNKYDEAYKYYKLSKKEINHQIDGTRDAGEYYIMEAELNMKFGNLNSAQISINKALKIFENEKSILRLNSEMFEFIISILNKSKEITYDSVKLFIDNINKFSNMETRLDILYTACMYLFKIEKRDLSYKIFQHTESYKHNIEQNRIKARHIYVKALFTDDKSDKLHLLNDCLNCVKEDKNNEIYWNVCVTIGDYYFDKKDYYYALVYYFEACEISKNLILTVPEQYRINYINFNRIIEPIKKFIKTKKYKYVNKFNSNLEYERVSTLKEIDDLFKKVRYEDIISNQNFIESIRNLYNSFYPKNIKNINEVLLNLKNNDTQNIDFINKYMAYISLASRSLIIIDKHNDYSVFSSSDNNKQINNNIISVINSVKNTNKPIIISELYNNNSKINIINDVVKACICIPIIRNDISNNKHFQNNRRKNHFNRKLVLGYIYIESERRLNNFNEKIFNECLAASKLIGIILEKHKLKINASIDKLTGSLTRKYLEISLKNVLVESINSGEKFSLIMFDLDHFKEINDSFGHQTGDFVLSKICEIVLNNIRETDILGRYGGEEFIIILPNTEVEDAEIVAEKLRRKIERADILGDKRSVTISIGISGYPEHAQWNRELIERADQALYAAKESGRNQCKTWSSEYTNKNKGSNKLSGIFTGNSVQNERNVLTMVELIDLINKDITREEKIYKFLGRIIEITEAEKAMFVIINNENIEKKYCREIFNSSWINNIDYNKKIIEEVISKKQGVYIIDWDNVIEYDKVTGAPDWKSVICVPIIKNNKVIGILYLSISTMKKEFDFDDFNFINVLSQLAVPII